MTEITSLAGELSGRNVALIDLAYASRHIVEGYNAAAALFIQQHFDSAGQLEEPVVLELPLSMFAIEDGGRTLKVTRGAAEDLSELATEYAAYCSEYLDAWAAEPEAETSASRHFSRYEPQNKRWFHFISFSWLTPGKSDGSHAILAIMESTVNGRDCRLDKLAKHCAAVGDYESEFSGQYRTIIDTNIFKGLTREHWDLDDFILLNSFYEAELSKLSFIGHGMLASAWQHMLTHGSRNTNLPWEIKSAGNREPGSDVLTVTVSLDLRKSTSMMEQAESQHGYAMWLETLSEICHDITLYNRGIFDKFTGDGIIAHFVCLDAVAGVRDRDCQAEEITRHAFTCASELVRAVGLHHQEIKPYLRFNIEAAGVAVGIAIDQAAWSLDRDGRPVVVGKGVVNACRLNGGNPGTIRLAYNMRRHLPQVSFDVVVVEDHKDLNPALRPQCYLSCGANMQHGRDDPALRVLVEKLASEVRTRHQLRRDRREEAASRPTPRPSAAPQ